MTTDTANSIKNALIEANRDTANILALSVSAQRVYSDRDLITLILANQQVILSHLVVNMKDK